MPKVESEEDAKRKTFPTKKRNKREKEERWKRMIHMHNDAIQIQKDKLIYLFLALCFDQSNHLNLCSVREGKRKGAQRSQKAAHHHHHIHHHHHHPTSKQPSNRANKKTFQKTKLTMRKRCRGERGKSHTSTSGLSHQKIITTKEDQIFQLYI